MSEGEVVYPPYDPSRTKERKILIYHEFPMMVGTLKSVGNINLCNLPKLLKLQTTSPGPHGTWHWPRGCKWQNEPLDTFCRHPVIYTGPWQTNTAVLAGC